MKARIPMILSVLALAISLTGVGGVYAAGLVNGTTIMNHTIGVGKLTPQAVKQLKGHDGFNGVDGIPGVQGVPGPAGAAGVAGAVGATGVAGGFNPAKVTYVQGPTVTLLPGQIGSAIATCAVGSKAIGGGFFSSVAHVGGSVPNFGGAFWGTAVLNDTPINVDINAYAVCAAA